MRYEITIQDNKGKEAYSLVTATNKTTAKEIMKNRLQSNKNLRNYHIKTIETL